MTKQYLAYIEDFERKLRLEIKEEKYAGFYIYVYSGGEEKCIADYLQDTYDMAVSFCEKRYNVGKR